MTVHCTVHIYRDDISDIYIYICTYKYPFAIFATLNHNSIDFLGSRMYTIHVVSDTSNTHINIFSQITRNENSSKAIYKLDLSNHIFLRRGHVRNYIIGKSH